MRLDAGRMRRGMVWLVVARIALAVVGVGFSGRGLVPPWARFAPQPRPRVLQGPPHPLFLDLYRSLAFSPDGKTLPSGGGVIKLWDVASGQHTFIHTGDRVASYSVAFSPDGKTLASGYWDGKIRLWDMPAA